MVLLLVITLAVTFPKTAGASTQPYTTQQVVDEVGVGNYEALSLWMSRHIKYRSDMYASDEWKEPSQTLKDGRGDCEDYATLILECLRLMGVQDAFLLGVSRKVRNIGHVVSIFRESRDQNWSYYTFEKLRGGPKSFKTLLVWVSLECRYGSNPEYRLADRNMLNIPKEEEDAYGINN